MPIIDTSINYFKVQTGTVKVGTPTQGATTTLTPTTSQFRYDDYGLLTLGNGRDSQLANPDSDNDKILKVGDTITLTSTNHVFGIPGPTEKIDVILKGAGTFTSTQMGGTTTRIVMLGERIVGTGKEQYVIFPNADAPHSFIGNLSSTLSIRNAGYDTANSKIVTSDNAALICYLQGTQIAADRGYVAVEDLREGDMVVCRFGGLRPIRWIGRQNFAGRRAAGKEAIRFAPGSIADGMPRQPLFVSPGHTMLVGETLVLADDLVNGITITREEPRAEWSYFQLDLGVHDLVLANGTWSESFADCGSFRDDFDNADDFRARFPDHVAPDAPILCAERPTGGPALHAAISHTARRALDVQGQVAPGRLEGRIEGVAAPCRVKGWAVDADHRGKPVMLDVLLDGKVIGQTIACAPRKEAGDHGRLNFVFDGSGKLTTHELLRLVVRRAEDGQAVAPLPSAAMGQLQGHLDFINDACRLEGWARDKSRPGEPVMLEAVLGEEILATFLASQRRHDLEKADLGDVAFALDVGRALSVAEMEAVEVRRMSDRAVLRRSDRTRMAFTAAGDKAA